jgi:hypothetical protein
MDQSPDDEGCHGTTYFCFINIFVGEAAVAVENNLAASRVESWTVA